MLVSLLSVPVATMVAWTDPLKLVKSIKRKAKFTGVHLTHLGVSLFTNAYLIMIRQIPQMRWGHRHVYVPL